MKLHHSPQNRF